MSEFSLLIFKLFGGIWITEKVDTDAVYEIEKYQLQEGLRCLQLYTGIRKGVE